MKTEMSTFDVLAVVRDMRMLVGGYVDKIFQWNRKSILLRINVPGAGKKELIFQDLKWLYISGEKPEMPDTPTQFVVHLRKHLSNGRIVSIFQKDFDRIVVIEVQKEKTYQIVFEIFGEGNLIVVSEGKIVNCVVSRQWKYRDVRPGAEYSFPPSRFNPITANLDDFAQALRASSSDSVRTLATSINLGGQYAEEICLRAEVDKTTKAKQLKDEEVEKLHKAMREIIDSVSDSPRPYIVARAGALEDVTPLPLIQYSDESLQTYATISEAFDDFLRSQKAEDDRKESEESRRLKRQLERQKETVDRLNEEIENSSRKAETIYTNYGAINDILSVMREKSESSTWDDTKEIGLGLAGVKEVDPATHRLIVEVNSELIRLDYSKGVEENADEIYK
ncbi:MAG: NFACT family protein, partial [Methanomassiliicoccales archaeon]|nr:NFACT family protein [Methanomassiliicoccales archaeon]